MTGAGVISTHVGRFIGKAHHGPDRLSQPRRQGPGLILLAANHVGERERGGLYLSEHSEPHTQEYLHTNVSASTA